TGRAALLVLAATVLWAQQSKLSVSDASWKGIEIRFVTRVEPPGESTRNQLPGAIITDSGRAHHIIQDPAHRRYFGYDVRLEPSDDGNSAQIRIEPLSPSRAGEISAGPGWTLLALPQYPVIADVKVGDTVALDLMVNGTGQKIVDYLTLKRRGMADASDEAHDFSLADVELSLKQPRVSVNGKLEATAGPPGKSFGVAGVVVWLYLAGHGRFVLSLFPNEKLGFQKNGVVSAGTLSFREGSTEYRVACDGVIAPGYGPFNLYVVHEADWRPVRTAEPFLIGSADKPEWVVGKH
ncbi:MAG TPA: hypothetical protein VIX37_15135, partial [Candidatus Sulfotelmatobacter sp.]